MNTVSRYARRLVMDKSTKELAKTLNRSADHINKFRSGATDSLELSELIIETYDHEFIDKLLGYKSLKEKLQYTEKQNQQYRLMLLGKADKELPPPNPRIPMPDVKPPKEAQKDGR